MPSHCHHHHEHQERQQQHELLQNITKLQSDKRRMVSFAPTATVRTALHIKDYTSEEIDATYYTKIDFHRFRVEIKRAAEKIDENLNLVNQYGVHGSVGSRGIIRHTRQASIRISKLRRTAVTAVLEEQLRQWSTCCCYDEVEAYPDCHCWCYDDTKIARVYMPHTFGAAAVANLVGLSDRMVAERESPEQSCTEQEQTKKKLGPPYVVGSAKSRSANKVAWPMLKTAWIETFHHIRGIVPRSA